MQGELYRLAPYKWWKKGKRRSALLSNNRSGGTFYLLFFLKYPRCGWRFGCGAECGSCKLPRHHHYTQPLTVICRNLRGTKQHQEWQLGKSRWRFDHLLVGPIFHAHTEHCFRGSLGFIENDADLTAIAVPELPPRVTPDQA